MLGQYTHIHIVIVWYTHTTQDPFILVLLFSFLARIPLQISFYERGSFHFHFEIFSIPAHKKSEPQSFSFHFRLSFSVDSFARSFNTVHKNIRPSISYAWYAYKLYTYVCVSVCLYVQVCDEDFAECVNKNMPNTKKKNRIKIGKGRGRYRKR